MNSKELYDRVISAYKDGNEGLFPAVARNWILGSENAPFENADARHLFYKAKEASMRMLNGSVDARSSKQRMVKYVRQIAEMDLPNPYAETQPEKPLHVLGVLPDPVEESEIPEAKEETEKKIEAVAVPTEEAKPHLFGKRKSR